MIAREPQFGASWRAHSVHKSRLGHGGRCPAGRSLALKRPATVPAMTQPPPLLQLSDIALTFGGTALLESAELSVFFGDRVALVGRNGSGKSTLLRIAAGRIEPDAGQRFVQPGIAVGYLTQEADASQFATTLTYVEAGLAEPRQARYLMAELGLDASKSCARLSGGELRRAALARALASAPEVLLLDETTNHLDLPAIEWLEAWLADRRAALVLVSHDRRFLAKLSRRTVWLDRGRTRPSRSALPSSRPGATSSWQTRRSPSTSSIAELPARKTGCAMASPPGASATSAA
jgi:ATPase subunit of ABC transporter with duplicated ATPase domains